MSWEPLKMNMKKNPYSGRLIVFDGIDGSGKSTYMQETFEYLTSKEIQSVYTRTPTDDVRNMWFWKVWHHGSYNINRDHLNELGLNLMAFGNRLVHQRYFVEQHLAQGIWVLCDRSFVSNCVHDDIHLFEPFFHRMIRPDLTVLLDIDSVEARSRLEARGGEDLHPADDDEKIIVRDRYLQLAALNNFHVIDTSVATVEESFRLRLQPEINKLI